MKDFLSQQFSPIDVVQKNTSVNELLLREIHLPLTHSETHFFYLLLCLFFALIIVSFAFFILKKWKKPSLKKEAIKKLKTIQLLYEETKDPFLCIKELSIFFRRVVLSQKNGKQVAGLTGDKWLEWLDKPFKEPLFKGKIGQLLLRAPYVSEGNVSKQDLTDEEIKELFEISKKWVETL